MTAASNTLRIEMPSLPPAEYSSNNSRGKSYWVKQKITSLAHDEIIAAVLEQGWKGEPLENAVVKVSFGLPDRRKRDYNSLIERFKPWQDALTRNPDKNGIWRGAGVLWDDDLDTIGWPMFSHFLSPKNPVTIIEVEGSNDGN